ncbi:MAG: hypothetical protein FAF03_03885 [Epsilonproteobacteria bacterium]|nr:hypothetical protein [Campylobacterota bacterium]
MSNQEDEKALKLLEQVVYKAQESLEKNTTFQPFLMLLTDTGKIEMYENKLENSTESYALLEEKAVNRIKKNDIDIMILAVDTEIPEKFVENIPTGIRIHLEEKSQIDKPIGARFLYVPYELCQTVEHERFVKLHMPIPVGFLAEYIKSSK